MNELLPCPFCGGEAQFNIYETTCGVECEKCRIGTAFVLIDDYKQAIQAWNTRAYYEAVTEGFTDEMLEAAGYVKKRTCRITSEEYDDLLDVFTTHFSCGHYGIGMARWFRHCPECGAKVVSINLDDYLAPLGFDPTANYEVPENPSDAALAGVDAFVREHAAEEVK